MKLSSFTAVLAVCFLIGCNESSGDDDSGLGLSTDATDAVSVYVYTDGQASVPNATVGLGERGTASFLAENTNEFGQTPWIPLPVIPATVPMGVAETEVKDSEGMVIGETIGQAYSYTVKQHESANDIVQHLHYFYVPTALNQTFLSDSRLLADSGYDYRWSLHADGTTTFSAFEFKLGIVSGSFHVDNYVRYLGASLPQGAAHAIVIFRADSAASWGSDAITLAVEIEGMDTTRDPQIMTFCAGSETSALGATFGEWSDYQPSGNTGGTPAPKEYAATLTLTGGLCAGDNIVAFIPPSSSRAAPDVNAFTSIQAKANWKDLGDIQKVPISQPPKACCPTKPDNSAVVSDCEVDPFFNCDNLIGMGKWQKMLSDDGIVCVGDETTVSESTCWSLCASAKAGATVGAKRGKKGGEVGVEAGASAGVEACMERCKSKSRGNSNGGVGTIKCHQDWTLEWGNYEITHHEREWLFDCGPDRDECEDENSPTEQPGHTCLALAGEPTVQCD